jgi:hypothetical protein
VILLDTILHEAISPTLALLPPRMDSREARVMLLAKVPIFTAAELK